MRITQWGEYGVLCSAYIAHRALEQSASAQGSAPQGNAPVGANEIASAQHIALDYAQQILLRLRRGNVIESVRGPNGGYKLARPASDITLYDILVATEGDSFQVICDSKPIDPERCRSEKACGLRPVWFELRDQLNGFLTKYTLADLADRLHGPNAPTKVDGGMEELVRLGRAVHSI